MWFRKKRDEPAETQQLTPEPSYWATHPESHPESHPETSPEKFPAPGHSTVVTSTSITVDGRPVDPDSDAGQHLLAALRGDAAHLVTEQHTTETTRTVDPQQQEQLKQLLAQRQAGTISEAEFAAQMLQIVKF